MKPKTKKLVKTFIILYVVMVLVAAVATLGWFVFNRGVNVQNGTGVNVVTGNYLRVAIVDADGNDGEYGEQVTYTPVQTNLVDVTGDGTTFYWPQVLEDETDKVPADAEYTLLSDDDAEEKGYYITFEVSLKGTQDMEVYLGKNSYIHPAEDVYVPGQSGYHRKSLYGDFSADGIAGAMRVSLSDATDDTLKQVWIPNDKYRISYDAEGKASFTTGAIYRESSYGYMTPTDDGTFERKDYTIDDYFNTVSVGNNNLATQAVYAKDDETTIQAPAMSNNAPMLCMLDRANDYTCKLRVRIWIEGTDEEADKALNGGEVQYSLEFVGIPTRTDITAENQAKFETIKAHFDNVNRRYILYYDANNSGSLNGDGSGIDDNELFVEKEVLYTQNGIDWYEVNSSTPADESYDQEKPLYIRYRETATEHASEVKQLILKH